MNMLGESNSEGGTATGVFLVDFENKECFVSSKHHSHQHRVICSDMAADDKLVPPPSLIMRALGVLEAAKVS